jgi:hypothetical protein
MCTNFKSFRVGVVTAWRLDWFIYLWLEIIIGSTDCIGWVVWVTSYKISGSHILVDKNPSFLDVMLSWVVNRHWRFEGPWLSSPNNEGTVTFQNNGHYLAVETAQHPRHVSSNYFDFPFLSPCSMELFN